MNTNRELVEHVLAMSKTTVALYNELIEFMEAGLRDELTEDPEWDRQMQERVAFMMSGLEVQTGGTITTDVESGTMTLDMKDMFK